MANNTRDLLQQAEEVKKEIIKHRCKMSDSKLMQMVLKMSSIEEKLMVLDAKTDCDNSSQPEDTPAQRIIREMECSFCYEVMLAEIFCCTNSHLVCRKCMIKLPHCPICRDMSPPIRNYLVERMVAIFFGNK